VGTSHDAGAVTSGTPERVAAASPAHDVPIESIEAAATVIARHPGVVRTPILGSRSAAALVAATHAVQLAGRAGDDIPRLFVKGEHLQATGSFKVRGALVRIASLSAAERERGIITLSAGNHAQAVAWAAAIEGIPVTVVMPEGASAAKAAAARGYGAEVVLHGTHVGDTFARMIELRDSLGLTFLHPFDDAAVIAGQGTVGLEILEDLPDVDVVVVGVGGGGLISGISAAIKQRRPSARVYGVEPTRSNALSLALAAGEVVPLQPVSIADGLGAPFAGAWTLDLTRRYVDGVVLLDDRAIARGMRFALERMKQLLEPAGAAALAAVLEGRIPIETGDTVCAVASGGNVDLARLPELLAMGDPG
jgi:threonine dehydratase